MCLILIACGAHPDFPLVVAANRDEYYRRPTAQAAYWTDHQHILAGRDLECMGTWLGVTRSGRFAALTNFRDPRERKTDAPSRGHLVSDFLASDLDPPSYLDAIRLGAARYNGFNLLAGDADGVFCYSNRESTVQALSPGVHGLSNHLLDTPWPKLASAKIAFAKALTGLPTQPPFFDLLADREIVPDAHLPETGVPLDWERILSAVFVSSPAYGTRASTLLTMHREGPVTLTERSFGPGATPLGEVQEGFQRSDGA